MSLDRELQIPTEEQAANAAFAYRMKDGVADADDQGLTHRFWLGIMKDTKLITDAGVRTDTRLLDKNYQTAYTRRRDKINLYGGVMVSYHVRGLESYAKKHLIDGWDMRTRIERTWSDDQGVHTSHNRLFLGIDAAIYEASTPTATENSVGFVLGTPHEPGDRVTDAHFQRLAHEGLCILKVMGRLI